MLNSDPKMHFLNNFQILDEAGISNCFIYSSLDSSARKIALGKFRSRKSNVMIVTDIAARGIDIPILDNVINFHFPSKPKLFMHRVGTTYDFRTCIYLYISGLLTES